MRKRPCLLFACIFLTGIVFQRYEWKCLWLVLLTVLVLEIYRGHKKWKRMAGRSCILLSAFFLGISHMKFQEEFRNAYMSNLENDGEVVVFGEILTVQETEYGGRLILTDCYVSLKETTIPCNQVMVYVSSSQYLVGQVYQIKGKVHLFEDARNEGNFDSALFYQSQKIDFSIYATECKLLGYEENVLCNAILELKRSLSKVYQRSMKEAAAGFYMGMMLGDKSLLLERTKELFAIGGISHILAISGLHMSMIGRGFYKFLRRCRMGFLTAGVLAGSLLLVYCYMVGSGTSAIRAVGMMLLFFLSQYFGRSYDMLNSLGAVVIYLLWDNPFLIEYTGFQFSIAALIGVGFVGQILSKDYERDEGKDRKKFFTSIKKSLKASLWMSLGITLTTLPIVASCYFEIPLYSPLVNSLVLPMLTPIFVLAVLGGLAGCHFPLMGSVTLIPCGWLYEFYEFVCEFVENLPFGKIITGKPRLKVLVLYYIVLFLGCVIVNRLIDEKRKNLDTMQSSRITSFSIVLCKCILSIICFFIILCPQKAKSEIIFLDVGQGDGIYIGSEDGTTCFMDGGSSDVREVGTYRILPFLKSHGVKRVDYWFVSHADGDHMSGLLEVIEAGYKIRYIVVSDKMPEDENKEKLMFLAKKRKISVIQMKVGDRIQAFTPSKNTIFSSEGFRITCLYPWSEATDRNEQSMVLLLEFLDGAGESKYKALFSGDISSKAEVELMHKGILEEVDLYKAAHHGSKYSNSQEFLQAIHPKICVISCGKENSYGHPHREVLEHLKDIGTQVFYTMEGGQLTFVEEELFGCVSYISLVK